MRRTDAFHVWIEERNSDPSCDTDKEINYISRPARGFRARLPFAEAECLYVGGADAAANGQCLMAFYRKVSLRRTSTCESPGAERPSCSFILTNGTFFLFVRLLGDERGGSVSKI